MEIKGLDEKDIKILRTLQENCKTSQQEISRAIGLSTGAVNERIRNLERNGIIRQYTAVLDSSLLQFTTSAFVFILVADPTYEKGFLKKIEGMDEVLECHHITGSFSFLLKVKSRSIPELEHLLREKLYSIEGIQRSETLIVLSSPKETSALPLNMTGGHSKKTTKNKKVNFSGKRSK